MRCLLERTYHDVFDSEGWLHAASPIPRRRGGGKIP
jgi:hypothetical protein